MKYFKAIIYSFYNKAWYRQMATIKTGYALRYLIVLSALIIILITIRFSINLNINAGVLLHQVVSQAPMMKLENGKLATDNPGTYRIFISKDKLLAIVNTDNSYKSFISSKASFWFGPNAIYYHNGSKLETIKYNKNTIKLDHATLIKHVKSYIDLFLVASILVCLLLGFVITFAVLMLLSWVTAPLMRSLAKSCSYKLKFKAARNLALASLSPFMILLSVFYLFGFFNVTSALILVGVLCVYPVVAAHSNKSKNND